MFNYNLVISLAKKTIDDIFNSSLAKNVVYKKLEGVTFDPTAGQNIATYSQYEIKVIEGNTALQTRGMSTVLKAIGFTTGDRIYIVKKDELPRDPNDQDILNDLIVDYNNEYKIKKVIPVHNIIAYIQV